MKVHPAAELFPMMPQEELEELARDIAANGLVHPLVIDAEGQLIDGRNRFAACKIAKVEPRFEKLNGRDPLAYIVSANLARRNLTKGQQAIALAIFYPDPPRGRGKKDEARKEAESASFSYRRLKEARLILHYSRELAQSVLKGSISLDAALEQVEAARVQATSTEAKHARLQAGAPDLAARVADENISLDEALAIYNEREAAVQRIRQAGRAAADRILGFAGQVGEINMAIDAGEDIQILPEHIQTLESALQLLIKNASARKE